MAQSPTERRWEATLRRKYGLSAAEWRLLWKEQGGKCPICGKKLVRGKGKACIDHDHKTGRVRGILCGMFCNKRVIGAMDKIGPERAKNAVFYLGWGSQWL